MPVATSNMIVVCDQTPTSVEFYVYNASSSTKYCRFFMRTDTGGTNTTMYDSDTDGGRVPIGAYDGYYFTVTGLTKSTTYAYNAILSTSSSGTGWMYSTAPTITTRSSGSQTLTYHYKCYTTSGTLLQGATQATSSIFEAPTISGYTCVGLTRGYVGYPSGSLDYELEGDITTFTPVYRYTTFYYDESEVPWYATTTYQNKLSSYTSGGSTNFTFDLNAAQVGYCKFTPTTSGTITVYSSSDYDMYGYLVSEGVAFDETASGATSLFSSYLKRDDDSQGNGQFKITYDVTANTSYRIYFCSYTKTSETSGSIYFTFTPSITTWQTPVRIVSISGSSYTTYSTTSTVNKYNAGYVKYTTPSYAGKIVFETTSGGTSPDYYSYLSTSTLSARTDTNTPERDKAVKGSILAQDDDGGAAGWDTLISYECNASTIYYWYVNGNWASSGTYSIPWKLNYYRKYTITYNANNGTGAPSSQSFYADNTTVTISSTTPTRDNYTFLGWSTNSSATSATYTAGSSPTLSAQNYTLYAVWKLSTYSVTISYNANGGTGAPSASIGSGNVGSNINIQISSTEPTRDRHIFKGWADGNSTTVSYQSGQTYQFSTDKTLYAVWENKFGADNVYYGINGEWKLCEVYYGVNDGVTNEWKPIKIYYGHGSIWKNNT